MEKVNILYAIRSTVNGLFLGNDKDELKLTDLASAYTSVDIDHTTILWTLCKNEDLEIVELKTTITKYED